MPRKTSNAATVTAPTMTPTLLALPAMGNAKPAASKPAASKPAASKPAASKPAASKPAASKPAASKPAASKPSPVRKDVKPADVTPEAKPAHTEAQAKEIATLEGLASKFVSAGRTAAERLANTIVKLYPLRPWDGRKMGNGQAMTPAHYFTELGNRLVATDQDSRRVVVKAMGAEFDAEILVAMTGSSPRTIARDRKDLGFINETRSAAQSAAQSERHANAEKPATSVGPVTKMTPVYSLTGVRTFIIGLSADGNTDALEELAELIATHLKGTE